MFDPNEACNVAGLSEHAAVVEHLRARLERWMRDTGDPLLDGPVPPPAGAEVNDPAQRKLLQQDRSSFEREWNAAGKWTLLVLPQNPSR